MSNAPSSVPPFPVDCRKRDGGDQGRDDGQPRSGQTVVRDRSGPTAVQFVGRRQGWQVEVAVW